MSRRVEIGRRWSASATSPRRRRGRPAISLSPAAPLAGRSTPGTRQARAGRGVRDESAAGDMTSAFGWRKDPFTGAASFTREWTSGRRMEGMWPPWLAGGSCRRACREGTASQWSSNMPRGCAHDMHTCRAIDVSPGQAIDGGSPVGKVGRAAGPTGPHLHFEVLENGKAVNPEAGGRLLARH